MKVIEPLGNASDVIVDLGPALFTVRVPGFSSVRVGDAVQVETSSARLHAFDVATGQRLAD